MTTLVERTPVTEDPGPPYLFFDLYPGDLGPRPAFDVPMRTDVDGDGDADFRGGILKASDGAYGYPWFVDNFQRLVAVAGADRGRSQFLGGYHYTQFLQPWKPQAETLLKTLVTGGWLSGVDIVPILDVEFGNERAANRRASNAQIVDTVTAIAEWLRAETGRGVMLYGRGLMRDRSITSKMGCDRVWNPAYTPTMVINGLCGTLPNGHPAPWTLDDIVLWQFGGDGTGDSRVHHLPLEVTGFGKIDLSVFVDGARKPTLERVRERLT